MGFHKRYISEEQVCSRYRSYGMQAVLDWMRSADALICTDEFTMDLTELLDLPGDKTTIWNQASEMISKKSLEIDQNSKESMTNCH